MRLPFQINRCTNTDYIITSSLLAEPAVADWRKRQTAIVFDSCLEEHHPGLLSEFHQILSPGSSLAVEGGEGLKDLNVVARILSFLAEIGLPKDGLLIAVGGGTVCDAVSLAATLFRRGVGLAMVPTTLLAQIDAAVGGKNGVNFKGTKNLVGHFYHAETVICDITFLRTLAERDFIGGLAEAIKVLAVSDARRFHRNLSKHDLARDAFSQESLALLVSDAISAKLDLLADDAFELSSRRLLNYGHAFAHNFEEESQYTLPHGEAVLLGMTVENAVAMELKLASPEIDALQDTITGLFTPECRSNWIEHDRVDSLVAKLKLARRNSLGLVCLRNLGDAVFIDEVEPELLRVAWHRSHEELMAGVQDVSAARKVRYAGQ